MKNELFNFGDFFISKVVISLIFLMSIGLLGNQWLDLKIQIVVGLNYMEIIWGWGHVCHYPPVLTQTKTLFEPVNWRQILIFAGEQMGIYSVESWWNLFI